MRVLRYSYDIADQRVSARPSSARYRARRVARRVSQTIVYDEIAALVGRHEAAHGGDGLAELMMRVFEHFLDEFLVFRGGMNDQGAGDSLLGLMEGPLKKFSILLRVCAQAGHLLGEPFEQPFDDGVFRAEKLGAGVGVRPAEGRAALLLKLRVQLVERALALARDLAFCLGEQFLSLALGLLQELLNLALALRVRSAVRAP
jgi:hypothetical protein